MTVCVSGGGGESGDDPRNRTCNPISLPRFAISSKEGIDRVLEKMTACQPLPGSDSSGAFAALGLRRWPTLSSISSFRNPLGTFEGWEWNWRNGEGSRRCHFSRPSPCALLAPRRKQRRAREKTARGSQGGGSKRQGSPGLAMWKDSAAADPGSRARTAAARHQPAQGLQVHFGAGPILCAPRRASGLCAPCRRRGAGAQCSPLTAAVGVDLGGRGGGGKALPPPTSTPAFFPSEREVPSFCGVSRLYSTMPSRVAGLRRTGRGLSLKGGAQLALKSWHFAAAVLSTGVVHPESSSGARCFVCRAT